MKSLSLSQPLVIMIVGKPGAGKSFFASQFGEMFGAPMVSVDKIQYLFGVESPYAAEVQAAITRIAAYQIEELLKAKKTILIDGGCSAKTERLRLTQAAKKAGYTTLTVWMQTDDATCKQRATKRRAEDLYNVSLSLEQFEAQAKRFTAPTAREDYVVVSGRHTFSTQAKTVLRRLAAPHELQAEAAHISGNEEAAQKHAVRPDITRRSVIIR
jgi:predicted kinase